MASLLKVIQREWQRLWTTRLSIWGFLIIPLLITILFFGIYYNAYVLQVPTVIVDKDNTESSRIISRYLAHHRYLSVDYQMTDYAKAVPLIHSQKALILIYIPQGFEKRLLWFNQPVLRSYSYGTNLLIGRLAQKAVVECISAMNRERLQSQTEKLRQESVYSKNTGTQPELVIHNLFNPSYNYLFYMSPAIILSLWQMLLLIIMIPLFSKEWEKDEYHQLKEMTGNNAFAIYAGKLFLPTVIMMIHYLIMYYIFFPAFHLPIRGNFFIGIILMVFFFRSVMNLAVIISNVIKQSLYSTEIGVFLTAPAFAFSGYTYPFYEMPLFHRLFAFLMPSTHALPPFSLFYLQDAPLQILIERFLPLFLYFLITSGAAIFCIQRNLK